MKNSRDVLRERLEDAAPLVDEQVALERRKASEQDNEKIYNVFRQLPTSDDDVDWDATFVHATAGDAKSLKNTSSRA